MVFGFTTNMNAQNDSIKAKENPFSISCSLMSRYVWRGSDLGASPSIQPGFEYSNHGLTIGAWGAYAINFQGYQESDLYLGYTFFKDMFSATVTDYYFQSDLLSQNYFDYKKNTTGHVYELTLAFNGFKNIPLSIMIATNIYGADAKKINSDGSIGANQYSTYGEVSYSFKYIDVFMGTNFTKVDRSRGESGYYGDYIGIVNLGFTMTKDIKISNNFNLPLSLSLITNPQAEKIFIVAGISI